MQGKDSAKAEPARQSGSRKPAKQGAVCRHDEVSQQGLPRPAPAHRGAALAVALGQIHQAAQALQAVVVPRAAPLAARGIPCCKIRSSRRLVRAAQLRNRRSQSEHMSA